MSKFSLSEFCCTYPVEVKVKDHTLRSALMYYISRNAADEITATCWMLDSNTWETLPISKVVPVLDVIRTIKINE